MSLVWPAGSYTILFLNCAISLLQQLVTVLRLLKISVKLVRINQGCIKHLQSHFRVLWILLEVRQSRHSEQLNRILFDAAE